MNCFFRNSIDKILLNSVLWETCVDIFFDRDTNNIFYEVFLWKSWHIFDSSIYLLLKFFIKVYAVDCKFPMTELKYQRSIESICLTRDGTMGIKSLWKRNKCVKIIGTIKILKQEMGHVFSRCILDAKPHDALISTSRLKFINIHTRMMYK